uniref:NADH dehydrogenase subunit 6 n=1 Tax=Hypleurochilus springeri TaxID=345254 RepID=UPI0028D142A3|nr:NADH dehydrogenase subunit 6 [Hypleurochilus springeri]WMY90524.1 NADH dehydrogenase subunit 6 [Hypleurochilus springeri]WNH21281.1 NADH dehydrogenase subunit 6 [Hypleurochilus geminatus]
MSYLMCLFLLGVVLGLAGVASNPSPFFAALGLVMVAGMGCGVLVASGGTFLSLILFLIYLGGMLVVFAYSAALAADSYPETWVSWPVFMMMMFYLVGAVLAGGMFVEDWGGGYIGSGGVPELTVGLGDVGGVALVYSMGGGLLVGAAWVLLLTLFVVLELTRGLSRGALRSV